MDSRLAAQVIAAALICTAAAPLLPWWVILGWATLLGFSAALEERCFRRLDENADGRGWRRRAWPAALFKTVSGSLHAGMAAGLIVKGGPAAREFAFAVLAASMVHGLMRYYRSRLLFSVCIAPHVAVLTWVGVGLTREALSRGEVLAACTPTATAALFAVLFWAARHQLATNWQALTLATRRARERERAAEAASEAKSSFLACMSHELRTPLNGVLGMAQVMARDDLSTVQLERLRTIRRSGQTLLSVLDDLLDLSTIESGEFTPLESEFDLGHLVRGVCATFDPLAEKKGLPLEIDIPDQASGACRGDAARLRRALSLLLSNAVKFTDRGYIRVAVERVGCEVKFHVQDTGVGITPEACRDLFAPFFQADSSPTRRFGGAGVGLAICNRLAQLLGGRLDVQSEVGVGSTFTLQLPLAPACSPPQGAAVPHPAPAAPVQAASLSVLAAEDNPVNQAVLRSVLAQVGIEPTIVASGTQALEAWSRGGWDLVLMDIQMPEMDGVTAARLIREREQQTGRARTPILAVTSNTMTHQLAEYAAAGIDGTVAKPIDIQQLFAAIDATLAASPTEHADVG